MLLLGSGPAGQLARSPHPTPLRAETSIAFDLGSTRCWFIPGQPRQRYERPRQRHLTILENAGTAKETRSDVPFTLGNANPEDIVSLAVLKR